MEDFSNSIQNILKWCFWLIWLWILFLVDFDVVFAEGNDTGFSMVLIGTSIWVWCAVRWIRRRNAHKQSPVSSPPILSFKFLLSNIFVPIVSSILIKLIIGDTTLTLISIPFLSYFTAKIEFG